MKYSEFLKTWKGTQLENRISRVVILALSAGLVILAIALNNVSRVVVLVPLTLPEKVELAANRADVAYLKSVSLYIADLLGNVRAGTAELINASLESLLAPEIARDVIKAIARQVTRIREDRVHITFDPKEILYEPETDTYFVYGTQQITGVGASKAVSRERTFEFRYRVAMYRPQLIHIDGYDGRPILKTSADYAKRRREREQARKDQHENIAPSGADR